MPDPPVQPVPPEEAERKTVYRGSEVCLVRDEQIFDPASGMVLFKRWEGTFEGLQGQRNALGPGWNSRLAFENGIVSLEATTPQVEGSEGGQVTTVEDQWDITTELVESKIWNAPELINNMVNLITLPGANPPAKALDARKLLAVWKATCEDNLAYKHDSQGRVLYVDENGAPTLAPGDGRVRLKGPTEPGNFRPRDKNGLFISDIPSLTMIKDIYELLFSNNDQHQTALFSITRRRIVPVDWIGRFRMDDLDTVWRRAQFIAKFLVPAHVRDYLLPIDPTILPYSTTVWGYKLRRYDAAATSGNIRVTEMVECAYGAYSSLTHKIIGAPPPPSL